MGSENISRQNTFYYEQTQWIPENWSVVIVLLIPNTAVFGPTKLIETTTTTTTARMKISDDEDF